MLSQPTHHLPLGAIALLGFHLDTKNLQWKVSLKTPPPPPFRKNLSQRPVNFIYYLKKAENIMLSCLQEITEK
jgi:hypothetical protein